MKKRVLYFGMLLFTATIGLASCECNSGVEKTVNTEDDCHRFCGSQGYNKAKELKKGTTIDCCCMD